jgi:hypothetical protein
MSKAEPMSFGRRWGHYARQNHAWPDQWVTWRQSKRARHKSRRSTHPKPSSNWGLWSDKSHQLPKDHATPRRADARAAMLARRRG